MAFILLIFLALFSAYADIPDNVLSSPFCRKIEHPGDDHLVKVTFSEADSVIICFGYSISSDNIDSWVLTINYSGEILDRQTLPSLSCYDVGGVTETFLKLENGNTLRAGSEYRNEQTTGLTVLLNPQGSELWRRNDWYNDHSSFSSAAVAPNGSFLLAGWTGEETAPGVVETNVLLAVINYDGTRIVGTELTAEGDQRAYRVSVTDSSHILVIGTAIQPGQNDADVFFQRLDFNELL